MINFLFAVSVCCKILTLEHVFSEDVIPLYGDEAIKSDKGVADLEKKIDERVQRVIPYL